MLITVMGLVIAERNYGESDRFIDVLTAEYGVIEICVKGARKITGKNNASTQLFAFAKFCYSRRNDRYYLNSSELVRVFYELRLDMKKLALAEYFAEICRYCVTTGQTARDIMSLLLNSLHFLSEGSRSCEFLKSVFEMRFMYEIGIFPQLIGCRDCYKYDVDELYFLIERSCFLCSEHFYARGFEENYNNIRISKAVFYTLQFICLTDKKRMFNFRLGEKSLSKLNEITEKYFLEHIGRRFKALEFYKQLSADENAEPPSDDEKQI